MSTYLPQEIVERILCKLPIKSRFRFLAVSKEWRNLITPIPNIPTNKTIFLVALAFSRNEFEFLVDNNDGISESYISLKVEYDDDKEEEEEKKALICASGYGLIVLLYGRRVILWNPFIRIAQILTIFNEELESSDDAEPFGIFVDYMNNECKVLMITNECSVEIFRLSTHSWEFLVDDAPFFVLCGRQVEIGGVLYWIGQEIDRKMLLVSFDGRTELFSSIELSLPQLWNNNILGDPLDYSIQVLFLFNESLIYIHGGDYVGDNERDTTCCNIWKMVGSDGEAWELYTCICFPEHVIPLGFRENGEFMWVGCETKMFVSTDLKNGSRMFLGPHCADRVFSCPNYVESITLLQARRE